MRVLAACEWSGVVRDVFALRGHDAWSCDVVESATAGNHIQDDVRKHLAGWDLIIAFPPCTHLAASGARWFKEKQAEQQEALEFVRVLLGAPCDRIALENPVGVISRYVRKPDQIIQPWQFGHPEAKATCLWLKGLPPLKPTDILVKPVCGYWENQTPSGQNKLGPSLDRAKRRGKTYQGIATAMAEQWG